MRNSKITYIVFTVIILLTTILACEPPSSPAPASPPTAPATAPPPLQKPQSPAPVVEETVAFPISVTDDLGRQVKINRLPQRIVSLAPSNTEILFALGLEDRIVGVTDYCDYPEAAKSKPRVASYTTPNMEKLVSLSPDLILAESVHEKTVLPALEKLGLSVIVSSATSIDSILQVINLIGKINGKAQKASQLVTGLKRRIDAVSAKTNGLSSPNRLRTLYVVWHQPIWTMGADTFTDDLIRLAGGINIYAADFTKSRIVSLESVINKNPQVIIVTGMATTSGIRIFDAIKKKDRLKSVDAMKSNRIYKISDANLIERPGPRIVDGLEELARLMHPELFGSVK